MLSICDRVGFPWSINCCDNHNGKLIDCFLLPRINSNWIRLDPRALSRFASTAFSSRWNRSANFNIINIELHRFYSGWLTVLFVNFEWFHGDDLWWVGLCFCVVTICHFGREAFNGWRHCGKDIKHPQGECTWPEIVISQAVDHSVQPNSRFNVDFGCPATIDFIVSSNENSFWIFLVLFSCLLFSRNLSTLMVWHCLKEFDIIECFRIEFSWPENFGLGTWKVGCLCVCVWVGLLTMSRGHCRLFPNGYSVIDPTEIVSSLVALAQFEPLVCASSGMAVRSGTNRFICCVCIIAAICITSNDHRAWSWWQYSTQWCFNVKSR